MFFPMRSIAADPRLSNIPAANHVIRYLSY
jgi:hypothetical protein